MRALLPLLLLACLPACAPFMRTIEDSRLALEAEDPELLRVLPWGDAALRYVAVGDPRLPPLVFVHGSPGSWEAGAHLLRDARLEGLLRIAYDRPGFGGSQPGQEEPSLARQAAAIVAILDALGVTAPVRLVGHSLGGAVIARFAMDYPERTAGLVFVAGSVDPALEKRLWYQRLAEKRAVVWAVPEDMQVANREIAPLGGELEVMLPGWAGITAPVAVVHAEDDGLVPIENVQFLRRQLVSTRPHEIILKKGGHLILWSRVDRVVDAIRWLDGA